MKTRIVLAALIGIAAALMVTPLTAAFLALALLIAAMTLIVVKA